MKKKVTTIAIAAILMVAGTTMWSCKKTTTTTPATPAATTDTNTNSARDNQDAETNSNDVDQMGSEAIDNGNINANYRLASGVLSAMSGSVTITPNAANKTVSVTFASYVGLDGHLRSGTIMYDYSTSLAAAINYRDSGMVINITTPNNDYYVDSNKVQVNKTITNKGRITNGNLTWHVTSSLTITKVRNGGTIQWSAIRDNILLNTNAISYPTAATIVPAAFTSYSVTINWATAVVGVTGSATGTSADGVSFTSNISTMLVRNFNCSPSFIHTHFHPFVAGQVDFTPAGKTTRSINFGTGACDEIYTVSIGSWSATFTYVL
ncbi:MAG TPA: hypothetical protein VK835_11250 [Bacteroidia bacterium]|nr:hypothetical protein [Bacteroidia bacterium]